MTFKLTCSVHFGSLCSRLVENRAYNLRILFLLVRCAAFGPSERSPRAYFLFILVRPSREATNGGVALGAFQMWFSDWVQNYRI